jgi:cell volume regulation protein A
MGAVELFLLTVAAIFLVGVIGEIIFEKTNVPDVIWLILVGILVGPVFGWVERDVLNEVAPFFGALTLVIVLFDGGSRLNLQELLKVAPRSLSLAILGFLLSILTVALLAQGALLLGLLPKTWTFLHGLMLGAIVGGASSVVIMPAMQKAGLPAPLANIVNLESALTDVLCVVMTGALIDILLSGAMDMGLALSTLTKSFGLGLGFGALAGFLWLLLHRMWRSSPHEYPLTLGALMVLYVAIDRMGGSAALGILTTAVIIGNANLFSRWFKMEGEATLNPQLQDFHGVITFMVKSFFFTFIGLMLYPPWPLIFFGVVLGIGLLLARIPAVWIATTNSGMGKTERSLITVLMPRGMAAGVLAILPFQKGVPDSEIFPVIIFSCVVTTLLLFAAGFPVYKNRLIDLVRIPKLSQNESGVFQAQTPVASPQVDSIFPKVEEERTMADMDDEA